MILAHIVYWIGAALDWYTTKRLILDKNIGLKKSGEKQTYKEINPVIRWIVGDPDEKDEWKILAFKLAFYLLLVMLGVPAMVYWWFGILQLLMAISNKWNLLGKFFD